MMCQVGEGEEHYAGPGIVMLGVRNCVSWLVHPDVIVCDEAGRGWRGILRGPAIVLQPGYQEGVL